MTITHPGPRSTVLPSPKSTVHSGKAKAHSATAREHRWFLIAGLPVLAFVPLSVFLSLWDFVALFLLPVTAPVVLRARWARIGLTLVVVAVLATCLSNLIRQIPLMHLRPLVEPLVGATATLLFLAFLRVERRRVLPVAIVALAFGMVLRTLVAPTPDAAINPWKYGVAPWAGVIVLMAISRRARTSRAVWAVWAVLAALATIDVITGFRSAFLVVLCTGIVVLVTRLKARTKAGRLVFVGAGMLLTATLLAPTINSQILGATTDKAQAQSRVNTNRLLAGRTEAPMSISAIRSSPLVGLGFPSAATWSIVTDGARLARRLGYRIDPSLTRYWATGGYVNTHSVLFGYWVAAGPLAAALPLTALGLCIVVLWRVVRLGRTTSVVLVFLAFACAWDLLFSPLTYGVAQQVAVFVVLASGVHRSTESSADAEG